MEEEKKEKEKRKRKEREEKEKRKRREREDKKRRGILHMRYFIAKLAMHAKPILVELAQTMTTKIKDAEELFNQPKAEGFTPLLLAVENFVDFTSHMLRYEDSSDEGSENGGENEAESEGTCV
jgi:hypothetical protein